MLGCLPSWNGQQATPFLRIQVHNFPLPVLWLAALLLLKIYSNHKFLLSCGESLCYNNLLWIERLYPFYSFMSLLPAGAFFCNAISSFSKASKSCSFSEFPLCNSSHIRSNTFDNRNDI